MSEPVRPNCDLCNEPLKGGGWVQWRLRLATAERVAHVTCFEEFYAGSDQPTPAVTSKSEG